MLVTYLHYRNLNNKFHTFDVNRMGMKYNLLSMPTWIVIGIGINTGEIFNFVLDIESIGKGGISLLLHL